MSDDEDMLAMLVRRGLITEAEAASVDAWAEQLAAEMALGQLTAEDVSARITERVDSDIARRGRA